jgi:hypothetical protein
MAALIPGLERLAAAARAQTAARSALATAVTEAYRAADATVEHGIRDGTLLRGEVLARWQELVGTGELMRTIQTRVAWLRDRVVAAVTGRPAPVDEIGHALESGLVTLVRGAAADAAERAAEAWRAHPAGPALLDGRLARPSAELDERAARMVRDWQRFVMDLVRTEAGAKRFVARAGAYATNAIGLVVMIAVFTATSFIPTGAEIVVAGGTTIAAQKVLEAIFGDQAVRELADRARTELLARVRALFHDEASRYTDVLDALGMDANAPERLDRAAKVLHAARVSAPLPGAGDGRSGRGPR